MNQVKKAKILAKSFHFGQIDRGGYPYVSHPIFVSECCGNRITKTVAFLHDIIEDTPCTLELLKYYGFSKRVINAVAVITHIKSMPYTQYIDLCMTNKISREVKFWDMIHNSDFNRIFNYSKEDLNRALKYTTYAKRLARTKKQKKLAEEQDKKVRQEINEVCNNG